MNACLWLFAAALLPSRALADQCARVEQAVAEGAVRRLPKGEVLEEICRACGERRARPLWVDHAVVGPTDDPKLFQVQVNGRSLDLADVFVRDKNGEWINLGLALRCGAAPGVAKPKLAKSDLVAP